MTAQGHDSRIGHNADQVTEDQHQAEQPMAKAHEGYPPVNVKHSGVVETKPASEQSMHVTYTILPHSQTNILPLDPGRYRAVMWLPLTGYYVVLCDSLEQAQSAGNQASTTGNPPSTPAGVLMESGFKLDEFDQEPLWAYNSDPTATAYVSVLIERVKTGRGWLPISSPSL
jgi:hypothetical protein